MSNSVNMKSIPDFALASPTAFALPSSDVGTFEGVSMDSVLELDEQAVTHKMNPIKVHNNFCFAILGRLTSWSDEHLP